MIEGRAPRRLSIRFWDNERVVLREPGRWEIRRWPSWDLVESGGGSLLVEWAGRRLAVIEPGGSVVVAGRPPFRLPAEAGVPREFAWLGDGLVASTDDGPRSEHGRRATSGGMEPALWWLPLEGPAVRLYTGPTGTTALSGVAALNGSVLCESLRSAGATLPTRRLIIVGAADESRDLAPELVGTCCGASVSNQGRIALSHGGFPLDELVAPMSFTLLVGQEGGPWRSLLPPDVRVWGRPTWSPAGDCLVVTAFKGIRLGIVALYPTEDRWEWLALERAASYRSAAVADGAVVAVRAPFDAVPGIVTIRNRRHRVLQPLLGDRPRPDCRWAVRTWEAAEGPLEGMLATPTTGNAPWPLVVDLHGGPQAGLVAGELGHLGMWPSLGYAVFAPDFRASGILGRGPMMSALQGHGQPDRDREADEVLSGVDSLVADGIADPGRLFLFGHSYGAYLLNRIVSFDHRFVAAVCWEGVADLRLLDAAVPGGYAAQRGLRGGSPAEVPERWTAASPVSRVDAIRTPMLLVYGGESMGPTHGAAWFGALREHGVPCDLVIYEGEGHLFNEPANQADMFTKAAAWFHRHEETEG